MFHEVDTSPGTWSHFRELSVTAKPLLLLLPLLFAAVHRAPAQDSVFVDPAVSAVVTGGRWTAEGRAGYYRIIIRTGGLEHTPSELTVQWLAEPARGGLPSLVRSRVLTELSGIGFLDRPQIGRFLKGWRLWVQVADTHSSPSTQSTRAVDLGPPGEAKVRPP